MKLRIVEPGFEGYTGMFGAVEFDNAVSVGDVSSGEARLLAAILRVVDAETGRDVGDLNDFAVMRDTPAEAPRLPTLAELRREKVEPIVQLATVMKAVADASKSEPEVFTKERLEEIADARGIAGVREIADRFGIKGTSITKLIDAILTAQGMPVANQE